jgi:hypothetical protein
LAGYACEGEGGGGDEVEAADGFEVWMGVLVLVSVEDGDGWGDEMEVEWMGGGAAGVEIQGQTYRSV